MVREYREIRQVPLHSEGEVAQLVDIRAGRVRPVRVPRPVHLQWGIIPEGAQILEIEYVGKGNEPEGLKTPSEKAKA